ncbi:hypothetical protein BDV12DRAFT_99385 [Aspergillus spectabilis]
MSIKMPGVEVAVSPASSKHEDRLLFKSHKPLPRRTNANRDSQLSQLSTFGHDGRLSDGLPLAAAPILPLTPPGNTLEESPTGTDVLKPTPSSHSVITALTPSKPSHPPTPETTPPRGMASGRPGLHHFGYISSSSRAESFQTAYERISDSETETPRPSPPSLSRSNTQRSMRSANSGQGQDSFTQFDARTRGTTPAEDQSPSFRSSSRSETPIRRLLQGPEKRSSTLDSRRQEFLNDQPSELRIKPTRATSKRSRNTVDADVSGLDAPAPTRGRRSLRDRVETVQKVDGTLEMDQFRQEIGWPSEYDQLSATEFEDSRRISFVSTSSTVEAMIIDPPMPARRALRHTEKRLSLRSASSPITKSERTSIASSSDLHRRLSHKPARITENDRRSIVSDMSISGSSTLGAPQQSVDVVPVIVIPQRSSSLKGPSNPNSRNPSISRSRLSSRAPNAPKSRPGSLDLSRQRKRTVSDPHASKVPNELRGRGMSRPNIPLRSSSLSAPTSQNNSRTTSLTTESLRSHNLAVEQITVKRQPKQQDAEQQKPLPVFTLNTSGRHTQDSADLPKTQSILIGVEDLDYLRPPSLLFTPRSIPSSSPGPFEINEVRRVAIFPHNNESLLLVNPQGQSGLREELRQVDQPQTPDIAQQSSTIVDSPLRNPRPPPQPPVSTAVTKFNHNPNQPSGEVDGELETTNDSNRRSRYKRRGWIVRPRSESFNSFVRTLSLNSAKNPKAGEDIDGRLQPFWRPRRFWDDSPESLSPEEDGSQPRTAKQLDEVISNSLGVPQNRIVFDGPALSSPRPGAKRRIDGCHRAHRETLVGSRIFTPEALYSQTSLHQRQFLAVSWWRLQFRSGMMRSLRWRLRRSVQRRSEGRREARREKLKQSIGEAVLVNSSTQVRTAIQ